MKKINLILLTGPSHAGKSTISEGIGEQVEILNSDVEVMRRIFHLWPDEKTRSLSGSIGEPAKWEHLREEIDFDLLFRVFHRDWIGKRNFPPAVLADGWIYHSRHWRAQVYRSLAEITGLEVSCHLWLVETSREEFFHRFSDKEASRKGSDGYNYFFNVLNSDAQRREHTDRAYDSFFALFEPPEDGDRWCTNFHKIATRENAQKLFAELSD